MRIDFSKQLQSAEYDFLRTNDKLKDNIILLGLGGSHAYGTNIETSDIDIRGIALNSLKDLLTGNGFEQIIDDPTDTVIYSVEKIFKLLISCNPNTIEMLGLKPEHYLYLSEAGKLIVENRKLFLSQRAANSFGGYANAQLQRLNNKAVRNVSQNELEQHILKTIQYASVEFRDKFNLTDDSSINLYIDKSDNEIYDTEIFADINLHHYPLRDYRGMINTMQEIIKSYNVIGKRNAKAIEHAKLGKHMMHLVRLYYMAFDILEKQEINTYRENEHDLLMSIRGGTYLDDNNQPLPEFFDIVEQLEQRLDYAKKNTDLPYSPDVKKINELLYEINSMQLIGRQL